MALTWRMWVLGIVLAFSVSLILTGDSSTKLTIFALLIGILVALTFIKSNPGKIFVSLLFLAVAIFLVFNSFESGVLINSVDADSEASAQGLRQGQIIKSINDKPIETLEDFSQIISTLIIEGDHKRIDIKTKNNAYILFTNESLGITVSEIAKTNIRTGLDISGGSRALISPERKITDSEFQDLIDVSRNRFNVFGISDVSIKAIRDFSGNQFMLIEVAGATPDDLEDLISKQGKFEARIGDEVVFIGGERDITNVCRNDATCASISACFPSSSGYVCTFRFSITLSPSAAQRHADITKEIPLGPSGAYLVANLTLVLDDNIVDELLIGASLKGQVTPQISIQGSGFGDTEEAALEDARSSMNELQTILITGSLPFKLKIEKLDTISPALGNQFVFSILIAGFSAIILVGLIVLVRYRNFKMSLAVLLTAFSELIIILGIASLIRWNLDLPSIAGILATIGTGVDQQIVILDEARTGKAVSISRRMKRALFVVMTAYLTSLVALLPLYWAGAGLFKGFAVTTIIGITAGVFITRPAFADMIKKMVKD